MVGSELPKHLLTHLHVVMRHVEHMACRMGHNDSGGRSTDLRTGRKGVGEARKPCDNSFQAGYQHYLLCRCPTDPVFVPPVSSIRL